MFTHSQIWKGLDRLADSFGYSPSGLARQAGLDPTSFNKSKRISPDGKPRWPSTESLAKVLAVTGATMTDFISLIDGETEKKGRAAASQTIPVIGFAQAGSAGFFDEEGYPAGGSWDEIEFPQNRKKDKHLYALKVSGDSMEPLYRKGDLLIVSPEGKIRKGDRIIVKTKKGEVMAKELIRQNTKGVALRSLNPDHKDRTLTASEIRWMARIAWVSQ